jgi:uncharacterized membrane protein YphA (DoxX/SURF4 family)
VVALAAGFELLGAIVLAPGLAVRWISVPLMVTMVVAAFPVHWENGWLAIAEGSGSLFATERTTGAIAFIRQSCAPPGLEPERVRARRRQPLQLQLE